MLQVATDGKLLRSARDAITAAFKRHGAKEVNAIIGHQGESAMSRIYWAEDIGIWFCPEIVSDSRYWNAFGVQNPDRGGSLSISCEINFPLIGIDRKIGAAVAKDDFGELFMVHRGRIGGGKPGIGPELFWNEYEGSEDLLNDSKSGSRVAVVAHMRSPLLMWQIKEFVEWVDRVKAKAKAKAKVLDLPKDFSAIQPGSGSNEPKFRRSLKALRLILWQL